MPKLGDVSTLTVRIKESKEIRNIVDKLLKAPNSSLLVSTSSWMDQFKEAFTVTMGKIKLN
jgi:hypothetical protein